MYGVIKQVGFVSILQVFYVVVWFRIEHCFLPATSQKMKFSIKNVFNKCDQIRSFLRIWSHLLKKSLMENFIFCVVSAEKAFTLAEWLSVIMPCTQSVIAIRLSLICHFVVTNFPN